MTKQSNKTLLVFTILLLLLAGFWWWLFQPLSLWMKAPAQVMIESGASVPRISQQIHDAGVPISPPVLEALLRGSGKDKIIKSGGYIFDPSLTPLGLIDLLTIGPNSQIALTVVEGWTLQQMRALLATQKDLKHDSANLSDDELLQKLNVAQGITPQATNLEGLFFPDTYLFGAGTREFDLYRQAYQSMQIQLQKQWKARADDLPYQTPYEALIMASLIEKETGRAEERTKIAAVFVNRLKKGMPLQTDPSVIYGMGARFDGNLQKKDLQTDSAYNTYLRVGLPPTPIALPGVASIQAALHPAQTNDLYFVARGDGSSHFSEHLTDHERAVNQYQRTR